jgi:hypothetical protein
MRPLLRVALVLACLAWPALAQRSNGYLVVAPGFVGSSGGTSDTTLHFAIGGEAIIGRGFGAGAEVGYFTPARDMGAGIGIASVNGYYHFRHSRSVRTDPFVTGGYSLLFRTGTLNTFNFGGGANIWLAKHAGIRAEFRDHVYPEGNSGVHYVDFRFGVSFR